MTLRPSVLHSLWDNAQEPPLPSPGSVEIIEEIEQGKQGARPWMGLARAILTTGSLIVTPVSRNYSDLCENNY